MGAFPFPMLGLFVRVPVTCLFPVETLLWFKITFVHHARIIATLRLFMTIETLRLFMIIETVRLFMIIETLRLFRTIETWRRTTVRDFQWTLLPGVCLLFVFPVAMPRGASHSNLLWIFLSMLIVWFLPLVYRII